LVEEFGRMQTGANFPVARNPTSSSPPSPLTV
jgi:hypothetical protein